MPWLSGGVMPFGQFVIGPPGSGKSTFCNGVQQFLKATNRSNIVLVNLDPANDNVPFDCDLDIRDLVSLEEVMEEHSLGPNGALLFCMETLEVNFDWLSDELARFDPNSYFIFDFPGQVELFTNHQSVFNILHKLERELHFRLVALHLVDSTHCKEPFKFISLALLTMQSMMRLECPQINVLSKFDKFDQEIVAEGKEKDFIPLTFYADCVDLSLVCNGEAMGKSKYSQLTQAISELIEDFGLVSFVPVAVEDKECMAFLMQEIDKANGLVFGGLTAGNESILQTSMTTTNRDEYIQSMENKYMRHG